MHFSHTFVFSQKLLFWSFFLTSKYFSYIKNDVSVDPQRVAMELLIILKPGRTSDLMAYFLRARNLGLRSYVMTDQNLNPG